MCDNLDDDKKQQLKKILTKDRKKNVITFMTMKKQLIKYEKKRKGSNAWWTLMMIKNGLDMMIKQKEGQGLEIIDAWSSILNDVNMCSIVDPFILTTPAFRLV